MTENASPRTSAGSVVCTNCGNAVRYTDVGCTHVDQHGALAGWLCPSPRLALATPHPTRRTTPIPASPWHSRPSELSEIPNA